MLPEAMLEFGAGGGMDLLYAGFCSSHGHFTSPPGDRGEGLIPLKLSGCSWRK